MKCRSVLSEKHQLIFCLRCWPREADTMKDTTEGDMGLALRPRIYIRVCYWVLLCCIMAVCVYEFLGCSVVTDST